MSLESLLGKMEEAAARIRVLEREKSEAAVRIQSLEREATELRSLISLAESKADEMLKGIPGVSRSAAAPRGLEELVEPSPAQQDELKRRFPHAFTSAQ
jgi:predicted  nucleic acid-binding Zn-ribbon protein